MVNGLAPPDPAYRTGDRARTGRLPKISAETKELEPPGIVAACEMVGGRRFVDAQVRPPASSVARWASASMPSASPLTTVIWLRARSPAR